MTGARPAPDVGGGGAFPVLHRVHRRGWINDPNGIIRHRGQWHVFFQHNPDSTRHHLIRWGHMSSADLVTWRKEPMGPVPRAGEVDADGCWTGVATLQDGRVHLVYSGVSGEDWNLSRVIVQRGDDDLTSWEPYPDIAAGVPDEPGIMGVRDPFLLELDGRRLAIQGAGLRRVDADGAECVIPAVLAWDRSDLHAWRYLGVVLTGEDPLAAEHAQANLWECPQAVQLGEGVDARWALILGKWTLDEHGMGQLGGVGHLVGSLTWDDAAGCPRFTPEGGGLVDAGPDFYAPQAYVDPGDGRTLLWGWSWEGAERTDEQTEAQGWAGCLTFPRELDLVKGRLVSRVPAELAALRGARIDVSGGNAVLNPPARAEVRGTDLRIELLDAAGAVLRTIGERGEGPATVLVDASIVEMIPAAGVPQTVRVYPEGGQSLRVRGTDLKAWELALPKSVPTPSGSLPASRP